MQGNFLCSASREWGIHGALSSAALPRVWLLPSCLLTSFFVAVPCPLCTENAGVYTPLLLLRAERQLPETQGFIATLSPRVSKCNFTMVQNQGWCYIVYAMQPYGFDKILEQFDTISSSLASSEFFQTTLWCTSALTFISSKFLPCAVISWITEVKC